MGAIAIETKKMGELDQATAVGVNDLVLIHTAEGMRVCTVKALLDGGGIDIPVATTAAAGIVKPDGTTILIRADGTLSAAIQEVSVATAAAAGIVKPDGSTITIKADGTISAKQAESAGIATTSEAGIVKPDGDTVTIQADGTISAKQADTATANKLGLVKPDGSTVTIKADGTISAKQAGLATAAAAGLVKPDGSTVTIKADGTISAKQAGLATAAAAGLVKPDGTSIKVAADGTISAAMVVESNAGAHNAIYRGKNLGSTVTAAQYAAIAAGTFDDLFIGDYWVIGGVTYRIAAFDYYYNTGDTACTTHHVTLVPDSNMYTHCMNDTNVTTGGYVGSKMYKEGLNQAKTTIQSAFGAAHILTHRNLLTNAVTEAYASAGSWYDSTVELMTEQNVYGGKVFGNISCGTALPYSYTVDKSQFPLFAHRPDLIGNRAWYWLRDVVSAALFAYVSSGGNANCFSASSARGVRPAFSIKS